jgi:hypothetical protein
MQSAEGELNDANRRFTLIPRKAAFCLEIAVLARRIAPEAVDNLCIPLI